MRTFVHTPASFESRCFLAIRIAVRDHGDKAAEGVPGVEVKEKRRPVAGWLVSEQARSV